MNPEKNSNQNINQNQQVDLTKLQNNDRVLHRNGLVSAFIEDKFYLYNTYSGSIGTCIFKTVAHYERNGKYRGQEKEFDIVSIVHEEQPVTEILETKHSEVSKWETVYPITDDSENMNSENTESEISVKDLRVGDKVLLHSGEEGIVKEDVRFCGSVFRYISPIDTINKLSLSSYSEDGVHAFFKSYNIVKIFKVSKNKTTPSLDEYSVSCDSEQISKELDIYFQWLLFSQARKPKN